MSRRRSGVGAGDKGNSVIDRPTEPPFNDRWQGEADVTWGDRPGIVASLLRYRVIVVVASLLGAVAGYGIAQLLPVRYQADAVLILSDPGAAGVLGGGEALEGGDRQVYLDKQADIMTSTVVLERALELLGSPQSPRDVRDELDRAALGEPGEHIDRRDRHRSTIGGGTGERGWRRLRTGHAGTRGCGRGPGDRQPGGAPGPLPGGLRRQPHVRGRPTDRPSAAAGRPDRRRPATRAGHHHPGRGVRLRGGVLRTGRAPHLPIAAKTQAGRGAGRVGGPVGGGGVGVVGGGTRPAGRGPG